MLCKIFFFNVFILINLHLFAQQDTVGIIKATVHNELGEPLTSATILLLDLNKQTTTDKEGRFELKSIPSGKHTIILSHTGYQKQIKNLNITSGINYFIFTMITDTGKLQDVHVFGYSEVQTINKQAYNVTAIDAKKLHNTTLDIAHILDRVPGARLRETGGLGSDYDFSVNGFSGKRIKYFLDGVPIDYLGAAFQINNIPVNFAERIEVYKGVIPVWLGSDALGGAINIVTNQNLLNFLDISYAYGSFNTHKTNIHAGITSKKGFTFRLNVFQNYSDNNYKVTVDAADINTGAYYPNITVRRFHDTYHNETAIAQLGMVNKKWADQLLAGVTVGQYYKEIQTGARLTAVFGGVHNKGNILMPKLIYKKKDAITKGLDLSFNANYNFGMEQSIDTFHARYNWLRDSVNYRGKGGERTYMWYKYKNNAANATAKAEYLIGDNHFVTVNNVFNHFDRTGTNIVSPHAQLDNIPLKADKNVLGLSYQFKKKEKLDLTVFGKHFYQGAKTTLVETDYTRPGDTVYNRVSKDIGRYGYGIAGAYLLVPNLQISFSFENTYRLPESEDLFGDATNKEGNWKVKPENSKNINLGMNYTRSFGDHRIFITATGIYSYVNDYIYYLFNGYTNKLYADNLLRVSNIGIETEMKYSYQQFVTAGIGLTYQNIKDREKYRFDLPGSVLSNTYKQRIPNIPYLFGNANVTFFLKEIITQSDKLSLGYNLLYVHDFYLYWANEGAASTKRIIPEQVAHDLHIAYTLKDGRYNLGLECKNITDRILYDNYSLQKPGRAFNIKLRYFITK